LNNISIHTDPAGRLGRLSEGEDPYCGTGGLTRAVPKASRFVEPDTGLFDFIRLRAKVLDVGWAREKFDSPSWH